ncbi:hypothetical protein BDQ94DRAFT_22117 [Aspergillus welwitschiae]|uniref:Uncharacterized protein n=1 Tax=Aspergillus welwitschiae TaxID=1341132 RepID=A0A3F3Q545_9EURO|nr:hypothetical protein BDQ94DRAFT_22117 [Aspergillus welwitschiae]RDH34022.1 hypothetical protein BDQ94DRAFT_22117 [Aspergillus welwitschiae]
MPQNWPVTVSRPIHLSSYLSPGYTGNLPAVGQIGGTGLGQNRQVVLLIYVESSGELSTSATFLVSTS